MTGRRAESTILQQGQVLMDRFVLQRRMQAGAVCHLWLAHDLDLETPILLRIYDRPAIAGSGVIETVKRDADFRRLRHPHAAGIGDLYDGPELLLVSIDAGGGTLLSDELQHTGPLPYRQVIGKVRPLIEALLHVHESGREHGRVDPGHVLVDGDERWVLLPGEGATPPGDDMVQLGELLAAMLTGGQPPEGGRQLNDAAERLHQGRTVPALLNQLVSDLGMKDAGLRPAGMRDVLSRLDQMETYLEMEPAAPPEPAADATTTSPPPSPAAPRTAPETATGAAPSAPSTPVRSRSRPTAGSPFKWLLVPIVLVVGALVAYPTLQHRGTDDPPIDEALAPPPVEETPLTQAPAADVTVEDPASGATDEEDPQERRSAEEALSRYLAARRQADEIGMAVWDGEPYEVASRTADEADRSFLDKQFVQAAQQYTEAAEALQAGIDTKDQALERLLQEGREALELPDAQRAATAFQGALMIEPGLEEARIGSQRAATLDELNKLLASGRAHETEDRLDFAHADYAAAAELDPHSATAATAYRRIKDRIADEQFQAMMSRGLESYHRGDYDEARTRLDEARRFRPDAPEVDEALVMVQEAEIRAQIEQLRKLALLHEQQERWQEAWNDYRRVLAIDTSIEFAQQGKARTEEMITLHKRLGHYLDNPDLLIRKGTREDAEELLRQLELIPEKGPALREDCDRLVRQLRLATTPLRVTLRSDGQTEVAVYQVGRYGTFGTVELELLPGTYTVVGQRKGYKDVRLTLHLKPGDTQATLTVVCTERI